MYLVEVGDPQLLRPINPCGDTSILVAGRETQMPGPSQFPTTALLDSGSTLLRNVQQRCVHTEAGMTHTASRMTICTPSWCIG